MISIAMTTYNGSKYVERQLEFILAQTIQADEIIICDDRSTDDMAVLIQDFIQRNKMTNVKLIVNEENLGYIRNFYKAIRLTQDDEWHSDKIEKSMQVMQKTNAAAICTSPI